MHQIGIDHGQAPDTTVDIMGDTDCIGLFGIPIPSSLLPPQSLGLQAEELYREWRSPSQGKERRAASQIKRSDPDRGLERVGRCNPVY